MAETKRYQYYAIVDKPNNPEDPNRKPRRTTFVYINSTGGTDPRTGEIIRAECKGIDPSANGIYTVDLESLHGKLKIAALEKAVKESFDPQVIGPFDTLSAAVKEQTERRPKTEHERMVIAEAKLKEIESKQSVKYQGER